VAALTGHLRTLQDADTRARLGANARRAVEPLTTAAMTLKLVLIYKGLLEASVAHKMAARAAAAAEGPGPATTGEAPPLHGADGLDSETLPAGEVEPRPPASPRRPRQ